MRRRWPTAVDLFAGCGGVTLALKRRHFNVVAAVDNDPVACRTFRANHPTVRLYEEDVRKRGLAARIRTETGLDKSGLDVLVVCAPCQPFSSQNRAKDKDPRAELLLQAVRYAGSLQPALILFENVPGLASPGNGPLLQRLSKGLRRKGYRVGEPQMVDAADYGVPQRRQRCILIASRRVEPLDVPEPLTPEGERVTVRDAIGHLKALRSGEKDEKSILHRARSHADIALERLGVIPKDGGSRDSLPEHLELACHRDYKGHPDVYGRMAWDEVAPTLTTGCTDVTRGRFAHPRDDRAITLLEAALLQTFPDSYEFEGNGRQIAAQIGNAVPPKLVESLAPVLRDNVALARATA